jgi:ESX secretion system protein EccC
MEQGPAGGRSRKTGLLEVPIGRRPDGEPVLLDLKEAAEGGIGPHGLVVEATGSGRSELLRTIVAGLAATHLPEQLAFVLVDFKGGAAFADLAGLPNVAGLITNLHADLSMVDRAMAALHGEQVRRQRLLGQAGNQPDLRAYTARRAADPDLEPLPNLVVVVDEFGELLTARPEFLDLFTAVGRVGRSLGMHLLLASQRLDEGRLHGLEGHLRYRICLRTFSAADSAAVLGSPAAYHLPPAPGSALLKVDATRPVRFTAALVSTASPTPGNELPASGADVGVGPRILPFAPTRPVPAPPPPAVGRHGGSHPERRGSGIRTGLDVVVASLARTARPVHQVWLPPLGAAIPLDDLLEAAGRGWLRVPVGQVDRPVEQVQEPLLLDLSGSAGHLAVVAAPRTGKSTLLCTVVAALAATHPPDAVQAYAIDLGGGLLHRLVELPHVGAVCGKREPERAHRLVRELRSLVVERERRFRDLGVDSMADWHELRRAGLDPGEYGEVFLVVDDWGAFTRELPELEAEIGELAAGGLHYGVHLVLAANRWAELRPGLPARAAGPRPHPVRSPVPGRPPRLHRGGPGPRPGRSWWHRRAAAAAAADAGGGGRHAGSRSRAAAGTAVGRRRAPVGTGLAGLFQGPPHLLVLGDAECGKTSLLRLLAHGLAARHPPEEVAILVVDPAEACST